MVDLPIVVLLEVLLAREAVRVAEAGDHVQQVALKVGQALHIRYDIPKGYSYPDGHDDGVKILATVSFDEDVISNSPRDVVRIEIHDERVIVVGTPVEAQHGEYEIEFDR